MSALPARAVNSEGRLWLEGSGELRRQHREKYVLPGQKSTTTAEVWRLKWAPGANPAPDLHQGLHQKLNFPLSIRRRGAMNVVGY